MLAGAESDRPTVHHSLLMSADTLCNQSVRFFNLLRYFFLFLRPKYDGKLSFFNFNFMSFPDQKHTRVLL